MEYGDHSYDLDRCRGFLDEERFEEAFELAGDLLAGSHLDVDVLGVYCDAALGAGRAAKALRACRAFLRAGVRDIEVLEWLVRAQWDLHLVEECRKACRRLLDRDPANHTALDYGLASLLELGDFDSGTDIIELASRQAEDPHLEYQVAVARMMQGEEEEVLEVFERFHREDPSEAGTIINLMRIHHLAKRFPKVEELFREAVSLKVEHPDLDFNMGLALKAQGRDREGIAHFVRSVRLNPDLPDAHFHLAQILRTEGHPRLALAMLQRELSVDDTHPAAHAEMAWCAEDLGEYSQAVRMIRAAAERAPEWGIYQHSLAEILLKADEDSEEAERIAETAVALDPEHAAGWQVLGRLAAERQETEKAERMFRRAVAAVDATAEDEGWLGLLLAETKRRQQARPLLERAARTFPFWEPVGAALGEIRGLPLPCRFEVRLARPGRDRWYRTLHVVAADEGAARRAVRDAGRARHPEPREIVEEVRPLGFELDHEAGVVWDSGPTRSRYPRPPEE